MKITSKNIRIFRRAQRKYNVSIEFLKANIANIKKFLLYAVSPHIVIKHQAIRKRRFGRLKVILDYYHLRRYLFDPARRKMIKRRKKNVQQWSKNIVLYLKKKVGNQEYLEDDEELEKRDAEASVSAPQQDVRQQLKEQLEILRSGKRITTLIEGISATSDATTGLKAVAEYQEGGVKCLDDKNSEAEACVSHNIERDKSEHVEENQLENSELHETSTSEQNSELSESVNNPILKESGDTETQQKTPEKQIVIETQPNCDLEAKSLEVETKTNSEQISEISIHDQTPSGSEEIVQTDLAEELQNSSMPTLQKTKSSNFLDMLMSKVNVKSGSMQDKTNSSESEITSQKVQNNVHQQHDSEFTDSSDEFLGFEDAELLPGMLLTPMVPFPRNHSNSAFVSESLNEYMRANLLESIENKDIRAYGPKRIVRQANCDGLVTPNCNPPKMDMPAVPESLQRLRTVAERRFYLQKFSKNHKLSIINNEATIYRELQRKIRQQKVKTAPLQQLQGSNSQMPFTRQGWKATSFIVTEYNKYFYQMLQADGNKKETIALPGSLGNNEEKFKNPYISRVPKNFRPCCTESCFDLLAWRDFKSIKTQANKAKLNKTPLRAVFKPCPLSRKPFQKPLDDETAALLLAGGSMAVVRMPTVELQVFPEIAKPLHEVAKRYLQYILPHHDISREWAEFSVSTLQLPQTTSIMKEAEKTAAAANAKSGYACRKSFTFAIPYLNDRNHILVRRVVDRSEQLDRSFEESQDSSNAIANLSFRANLDLLDTELQECADIVSDMINSVAISCSENSFIKEDPHGMYAEHSKVSNEKDSELKVQQKPGTSGTPNSGKAVAVVQPQPNRKQNRLLCELRRLNATIIDAAAKPEKESKPCAKDYCVLGCICSSLADEYPMRHHCGKSKCVIDCTCKIPQSSRIMRLETDGRSITTEDAFLLRRKATARLARMEKEFTSTIVLTENETLLINESQYDKKRRCTKAPKRYDDFTDDDDYSKTSPKKTGALVSIDGSSLSASYVDERSIASTGYSELPPELREPVFIKDTILNELKHCTVPLVPIEDMKNVAIWCMVHELYKCFCGGRALEGKPLAIEKEDENATVAVTNIAETENMAPTSKARYSFEKVESTELKEPRASSTLLNTFEVLDDNSEESGINEENISMQTSEKDETTVIVSESEHGDNWEPITQQKVEKRGRPAGVKTEKRGRPLEESILRNYLNAKLNWCRRAVAVPKKTYTRRNRKRLPIVLEYIEANENAKTRLILNEHILRSVYYHKNELEKMRLVEEKKKQIVGEKFPDKSKVIEKEPKQRLEKSKFQLKDEDDDDVQFVNDNTTAASHIMRKPEKQQQRHKRHRKEIEKLEAESMTCTITDDFNETQQPTPNKKSKLSDETDASDKNLQIPVISSCYSLNDQSFESDATSKNKHVDSASSISVLSSTADICAATEGAEHQTAADLGLIDGVVTNANFKEFYNVVIKNMNSLVSKKMQDIDMALKRESKVIPPPNEEILCIIKWSNFLDAFIEGFVFIWEVRMQNQHFFAATTSNLMPMILGAVSVINIAAMDVKNLPLIGRMLVERCRSENTSKLAIVMQGRNKYWLVKGFLHPEGSKACARPTPQTHPFLTKKINVLCSLLVKQRVKEYQRKMESQQRHQQKPETVQLHNRPVTACRIVSPPSEKMHSSPAVKQHIGSKSSSCVPKSINSSAPHDLSSPQITLMERAGNLKPKLGKKKRVKQAEAQKVQPSVVSSIAKPTNLDLSNATSSSFSSSALRSLSPLDEINNMKSNIEFRRITREDIAEIHQPEFLPEDHRWLVLQLYNDFSHIFVPDFRDLVSLDRIHKVMAFSRQKNKIVKLQFFQNAPYDAFVTPSSNRKIYFGPLKLHMDPPLLILLQSVDGQMMLREIYQTEHHIPIDTKERTTAFWMIQLNEQLHFEIEEGENPIQCENPPASSNLMQPTEDSDDDCMIVDNELQGQQAIVEEDLGQLVPLPVKESYCPIITNPQSSGVPILANALPQTISLDSPTGVINELPARMNFTIQTMDNNKLLQITPDNINCNLMQTINSSQVHDISSGQLLQMSMNASQTTSGFVPLSVPVVITNAVPAPQAVPYGSTVYASITPDALAQGTSSVPITSMAQLSAIPSLASTSVPLLSVAKTTSANIFTTGKGSEANTITTHTEITKTLTASATLKSTAISTAAATQKTTVTKGIAAQKLIDQGNISQSSPSKTGLLSIKRRRMSLRCPMVTDLETTNIAIDAAIKLLPEQYDAYAVEKQNSTELVKRKTISTVADRTNNTSNMVSAEVSKALSNPGSTMMLHNTTITKLKDAAYFDGKNNSEGNKFPLKDLLGEAKPTSAPVVFDVNFIDSSDEPAVSIVIKPTIAATLTSTTLCYTTKTVDNAVAQNVIPKLPVVSSVSAMKTPVVTTKAHIGPKEQQLNDRSRVATTSTITTKTLISALPANPTIINKKYTTLNPKSTGFVASTTPISAPSTATTSSSNTSMPVMNKPKTVLNTINKVFNTKPIVSSNATHLIPEALTSTIRCITKVIPAKQHTAVKPSNALPNVSNSGHVVNLPPSKTVIKLHKAMEAKDPLRTDVVTVGSQPRKLVQTMGRMSLPTTLKHTSAALVAKPIANTVSNLNAVPQTDLPTISSKIANINGLNKNLNKSSSSIITDRTSPVINNLTSASVPSTTAKQLKTVELVQPDIQYGHFCTNTPGLPKFVTKRIGTEFLLRVTGIQGILKLNGAAHVNTYINKHLLKLHPSAEILQKLPAIWRFVPQDRSIQTHKRTKCSNQSSSAVGGTGGNTLNVQNIPIKLATMTSAAASISSASVVEKPKLGIEQNETILIDD